jgi:hypothetical protein
MNTTSINHGTIIRAILFCFLIAIMGTAFVSGTDAKPVNIKSRVQSQKENCEDIGGGKLQVSNQYKVNGPFKTLVQSTTKCVGGTQDGYTCVNTRQGTKCHQARVEATVPPWKIVDGPLAPITADEPFASPEVFNPFDIQASPVPFEGG